MNHSLPIPIPLLQNIYVITDTISFEAFLHPCYSVSLALPVYNCQDWIITSKKPNLHAKPPWRHIRAAMCRLLLPLKCHRSRLPHTLLGQHLNTLQSVLKLAVPTFLGLSTVAHVSWLHLYVSFFLLIYSLTLEFFFSSQQPQITFFLNLGLPLPSPNVYNYNQNIVVGKTHNSP